MLLAMEGHDLTYDPLNSPVTPRSTTLVQLYHRNDTKDTIRARHTHTDPMHIHSLSNGSKVSCAHGYQQRRCVNIGGVCLYFP